VVDVRKKQAQLLGRSYSPDTLPSRTEGARKAWLDETYEYDEAVKQAVRDTPLGAFDLFENNCCHWARKVIEAAGLEWPYREGSLNLGFN
jgi:hypothetical protein